NNRLRQWDIVGGAFAKLTYKETPPTGGILVGFRVSTINNGQYPGLVQPIYLTSQGEILGQAFGKVDKTSSPIVMIKAKPGFAVGALYTRGGGGIDAIRPIFMRMTEKGVDPMDRYDGPYIGGPGGGENTLGGDGNFIVGLHGKIQNDGR